MNGIKGLIERVRDRPPLRRWQKITLGVALFLGGVIALSLVVGSEAPDVWRALRDTSLSDIILLTALVIPGLITRTESWRISIKTTQEIEGSAAESVGRSELYLANSVGLLANQLSMFLGIATQVATLRKIAPHAPNITRLLAANVPVNLLEALAAGLLLLWALFWLGLPIWLAIGLAALALALSVVGARLARAGRADDVRHWLHGLNLLRQPSRSALVGGLMMITLLLTVIRIQISLNVFDVNVSFAQAVLALLLTGVLGTLGLGPSAIPGGLLIIFNNASIAAATSAGLLALGTTALATLIFTAGCSAVVWIKKRRAQRKLIPRASGAADPIFPGD